MTRLRPLPRVFVRVAAATVTMLALAVAFAACGEGEEDLAPDATLSPASVSPPLTTSPTQTAVATPATPPAGWVEYTNKDFGFSLYHPAEFVPEDLSSTTGPNRQWVIVFVNPKDRQYSAVVAISENTEGLSLADWTSMNVCDPAGPQNGGEQIEIAGTAGLFCWVEEMDDRFARHVVFARGILIFDLQTGEDLGDADLQAYLQSFRLTPDGGNP